MRLSLFYCLFSTVFGLSWAAPDPTLYEYYTSGGIHSGLKADTDQFSLNGKHFVIYGGSLHYFRVAPEYWRPVLARFKAAGLNTVQLYVPWNLHEEIPGKFDFESPLLNLDKFLEEIKRADMFAIVRPGPFICAEWELGGFPSWLLRDPHLQLRTHYKPYLDAVIRFWDPVLKIVNKHQFSTTGGPVIMLQIENEYQNIGGHDQEYLHYLHDIVQKSGFKQQLFTSDPNGGGFSNIKNVFPQHDVLETANFNRNSYNILMDLKKKQVNRPSYVSEFWPGWFDAWGEKFHHTYSVQDFDKEISDILFRVNGSVNFYMFIGGTNFAFTNGDRVVTSYDYDAPLSESGNYTAKYWKTKELYEKLVASGRHPKVHIPEVPKVPHAHAYGRVTVQETLSLEQLLAHARKFTNIYKPVSMEMLNFDGKDYGQRFGFILYRVETNHAISNYEITGGIRDRGVFLVDNQEVSVIEEHDNKHFLHHFEQKGPAKTYHYDILVENMGRAKFGGLGERKGIQSDIKIDGTVWTNFTVFSLDFEKSYVESLKTGWTKYDAAHVHTGPTLCRAVLHVDGSPADTYLHLPGWTKGNVFVNGFNIGRYWRVGPQQTLYVPAPLLKTGANSIEVFELHKPAQALEFLDHAILH